MNRFEPNQSMPERIANWMPSRTSVLLLLILIFFGFSSCRSKSDIDHINEGLDLSERDLLAAIEQYDFAIKKNPRLGLAYTLRGGALCQLGKHSAALEDLDCAIALGGSSKALALNNRAIVWREIGDYDRAMLDHTRSIQSTPEFAVGYGQRAATFLLMGQWGEAARDYKHAVEIEPDYDLAHIALASIYANSKQKELLDAEKAIEHATQACELTSYRIPKYLEILSDSYHSAGMEEKATTYLNRAKQLQQNESKSQ
jgi:tetratricopeptide (TPR) repeat protein